MELALNLIWLAIAVGSFVALARWIVLQPDARRRRARVRLVSTAVVCLVALAFPIISITDDLSNDVLIVDTCVKRRTSHDSAHHERIVTAVATVVLSAPQHRFELASSGLVAVERIVASVPVFVSSLSARAPPFGLC